MASERISKSIDNDMTEVSESDQQSSNLKDRVISIVPSLNS
ncbi:conserved hypothetical protein [Xenorhabdus bovienii str. oregonense]|uniref:Uncharacterized protein n=1 Tax=Xenorhabdus bovienii str. oregonense TaxID=1398202 RepID=A0A077P4P7_XENBV|nr:conserved hypothetical protein [Xenorhabdus bovienii str. oregonense]